MQIQNPAGLNLPESLFGGGLVLPYLEYQPEIGENVYVAPNATVIGRTKLGNDVSIWFNAVLRGDIAAVEVGEGSNIQDNSVLHVGNDDPCIVGKHCIVGHNAILHGCTVEDHCLIGMGAIVLNQSVIGKGSVIGAGALVTENTVIPEYSLVVGSPAKVKRILTEEERENFTHFAPKYVKVAGNYKSMFE